MDEHDGKHGCRLQVEMFERRLFPDPTQASDFVRRARDAWPKSAPEKR
jgi:hypothetical protein